MKSQRISPLRPSNIEIRPHIKKGIIESSSQEDKENIQPSGIFKKEKQQTHLQSGRRAVISWLQVETKHLHPSKLRRTSPRISNPMRTKLIKWLIEVSDVLKLDKEVLFLALDILDRFLATNNAVAIGSEQFQLVGITTLFVASKCESVDFCSVSDYAEMTAQTFSAQDLVSMEITIMTSLDWNFSLPTTIHWLKFFLQIDNSDFPTYSQYQLVKGSKMLTNVLLDGYCTKFRRSVLSFSVYSLLSATPLNDFFVFDPVEVTKCVRYVWSLLRGEVESLSALGYHVFESKDSRNVHNQVHWDSSFGSKPKRPCSIE